MSDNRFSYNASNDDNSSGGDENNSGGNNMEQLQEQMKASSVDTGDGQSSENNQDGSEQSPEERMKASTVQDYEEEGDEGDDEGDGDEKLTFEEQIMQQHLKKQYEKVEIKINRMTVPVLMDDDKEILQQAKHTKSLKARAVKADFTWKQKIRAFMLKILQFVGPIFAWMLFIGFFFFCALAFAAAIDSIFSSIFGGGGSGGGMNSQFGADGNNFYAVRLVYKDDEQASKIILNDYANIVYGALEKIDSTNDYTININVTIPADKTADFNPETADEKIKNLMGVLTEKAYVYDNPNYASLGVDISTLTLAEKAKNIKYFGVDSALIGQFKTEIVENFILFNFNTAGGVLSYTKINEESSIDDAQVKANIQAALNTYFDNLNNKRSEKYFVKDCALSGDGKLTNVEQKEYVAMMYLPRKNVTFKTIKFQVYGVNTADFSIDFNGRNYKSFEEWPINDGNTSYYYTIGENLNISAPAVSGFDAEIAATPTALYKLADNANYTQTNADGILTYQEFGTMFKFNSSQPFAFADEIELR